MDKSYTLFRSYWQTHQAEMDLNKLKSEGIDSYVTDGTWVVSDLGRSYRRRQNSCCR